MTLTVVRFGQFATASTAKCAVDCLYGICVFSTLLAKINKHTNWYLRQKSEVADKKSVCHKEGIVQTKKFSLSWLIKGAYVIATFKDDAHKGKQCKQRERLLMMSILCAEWSAKSTSWAAGKQRTTRSSGVSTKEPIYNKPRRRRSNGNQLTATECKSNFDASQVWFETENRGKREKMKLSNWKWPNEFAREPFFYCRCESLM